MQQINNPVISLRATGSSVIVAGASDELVFNNTDIVIQDPSAFTFTQDTVNWGDDTQAGTATNVNWLRCMGGTSPDRDDLELESISISSAENGADARVAVYQDGSLSDPQAATLVWDGGIINDAVGFVTASGANVPLAGNEPTWVCIKDDDNDFDVHYDESHDASSDYQSGVGRWQATGISNDETVTYPGTLAGGGTSFSAFWYSWYLTYKTAEGSVTVDQDGLYKVSYSGLLFDDTFNSSRAGIIGKIQTNSTGSFVDDGMIEEIASVYANKGYDSGTIRNYLKNRNIVPCIPKRNYKTNNKQSPHQNNYNKTRFVVERFFAWLKNGFHRTRIRYEKIAENYLTFVYLACIMMYWRVLG